MYGLIITSFEKGDSQLKDKWKDLTSDATESTFPNADGLAVDTGNFIGKFAPFQLGSIWYETADQAQNTLQKIQNLNLQDVTVSDVMPGMQGQS